MLKAKIDGKWVYLPVIDFHTHLGKRKERTNFPQNILDFYEKMQFHVFDKIKSTQEDYFIELPSIEEFSVPMFNIINEFMVSTNPKFKQGFFADYVVSFPFDDIYHLETRPKFIKSNKYVRSLVNNVKFCFKMLSFCRLDPTDGDIAIEELKQSVKYGVRGLKLHPLSQGWIKEINTEETVTVLQEASNYKLPIIFDVPNVNVAKDITKVSQKAREEFNKPVNVILGHCGFEYSSEGIFECLNTDGMYGETSGMRGEDVHIFFSNALKLVENFDNKLLYGSDHNYFSQNQAGDFVSYLLSKRFKTMYEDYYPDGNIVNSITKILGGNAINLLRPIYLKECQEIVGEKGKLKDSYSFFEFNKIIKEILKDENSWLSLNPVFSEKSQSIKIILTIKNDNFYQSYDFKRSNHEKIILLEPIQFDTLPNKNDFVENIITKNFE